MHGMPRRRTALFVLALGTALAASLLGAPQASATHPPKPPSPPAEAWLPDFADQLGLTVQEARQRLRDEAEAAALQAPATAAAGHALGGSWFDARTGNLVVTVTDPIAYLRVRRTGADVRLVPTRLSDLEAAAGKLDQRAHRAPGQVTGWYVDEPGNRVVVSTTARHPDLHLLAFLLGVPHVSVEYGAERPRTTADLVGGQAVWSVSRGVPCSLGFTARRGSQVIVLTAGHCTALGGSWQGFNRTTLGSVGASSYPGNDYGYITVGGAGGWVATGRVQTSGTSTIPVIGAAEAAIGTSVCRSGTTTGYRCGVIQARNQTASYGAGNVVSGLTRTNVCAESGDSGGPFFTATGMAQGMTSGGSGSCASGGTTFFQPVQEALGAYGATLVTG